MTLSTGIYLGSVILTLIIFYFLAMQAWSQRKNPGHYLYFWLMVGICLLALLETLSIFGQTPSQALFWFKLRFLPLSLIPPIWFLFVLDYSGRRSWISKGVIIGLLVIPVVTQCMVWIPILSPYWVTREISFYRAGLFWLSDVTTRIPAIWYYIYVLTSVILLIAGSTFMLITARRIRRADIIQTLFLSVSAVIPLVFTVVTTFNWLPKGGINPTLLGLSLSGICLAVAIFRFDFLRKPAGIQNGRVKAVENQEKGSLVFFILLFVIVVIVIAVFGIVSFTKFENNFYAQVENQLVSITDLKIRELLAWKAEQLGDAQMLQSNPEFSNIIQAYLKNPSDAQATNDIQSWFNQLISSYQYNRVFFLDTKGVERLSSPQTSETVDPYLVAIEHDTLLSRSINFVDFYKDTSNAVFLALEIPIYENGDVSQPQGVVVLRIDPYTYLYPYLQQWPMASATAETLLIRKDGNSVLYLSPLRFQPDAPLNFRVPLNGANLLEAKAINGASGTATGIDYRNQSVIGAYAPVGASTDWYLVTRMDLSEADAPLQERAWESILFFGAIIVASGSSLWVIWRQRFMQYYQQQTLLAEELGESQLQLHQSLKAARAGVWEWNLQNNENTWSDEIWELYGLEFHSCPPTLDNWRKTIFPEDRAETVQKLVVSAQNARELNAEWRVQDRSGQIRWLMSRGSPLFDPQGKATRYSGTVVDITEHKQMVDALSESEDKFHYMFDYSMIGNSITQPSGVLHVNKTFYEMLGYSQSELEKKSWQEITYPDDIALTQENLDEIIAGKVFSKRFEKRYLHKDGSIVWADVSTLLRRDKQGQPLYYMTTILDITEKKKAMERQDFLYGALNATINEIFIFNADTLKFEFVSTGAQENLGYSMAELEQMTPLDIKPAYTAETFTKLLEPLRKGEVELLHFETVHKRKDGSLYPVEAHLHTFEQEGHQVFLAIILDITERQKTEHALKKSEERFFTLFEKAPFSAMLTEFPDGKIVEANQVFEQLTGYRKSEVVGFTPFELNIFTDPALRLATVQLLEKQSFWHDQVLSIRTKGGDERTMLVNFDLVEMSGDKYLFISAQDISERKKAEEALQNVTDELKRSNTELEQFAYIASHDLQEPLRMISSYLQLIERRYKGQLDQNADEFIFYAVDGATRMQHLINDLLAYSRVGTRGHSFAEIASEDALKLALENLQIYISENEAKITYSTLPVVYADQTQLVQVFQNLVGNAIKFHGRKIPQVHISAERKETEWVFSIKDNGIGIDPQYAERIFIIFQRLHGHDKYEGTGIGLAVCKKIIDRHGGRIWVESTAGEGATFYFTLPDQEHTI